MDKLIKVVMYITRVHDGERQFLVVRAKDDVYKIPTGKVGDHIEGESAQEAVEREVMEEIAVRPDRIIDLDYTFSVFLKLHGKMSEEHGFLVEIPDVEVEYLEDDDDFGWYSTAEAKKILSYDNHKNGFKRIEKILSI